MMLHTLTSNILFQITCISICDPPSEQNPARLSAAHVIRQYKLITIITEASECVGFLSG